MSHYRYILGINPSLTWTRGASIVKYGYRRKYVKLCGISEEFYKKKTLHIYPLHLTLLHAVF